MGGKRRRKRQRLSAQDTEAARRTFLDALDAQRAKARTENQSATTRSENASRLSPAVGSLRGFYYDEAKRRYFRSCPTSAHLGRTQVEMQQKRHKGRSDTRVKNGRLGYGLTHHNWVTYLRERQSVFGWSACSRDRRDLMPQWLSGYLSSQVVESQNVAITTGQLTALALHSQASTVGALGSRTGQVHLVGQERHARDSPSTTASQRVHPLGGFHFGGEITSLQWRPVQDVDLLVCHLGSGPNRNVDRTSGNVCFVRLGAPETRRAVQIKKIKFVDPWTAKWNPTETSKFSVGCGGAMKAAYVDITSTTGKKYQRAPTGALTSDVNAQSFFPSGHIVLNGTKRGGLWGWDLRSRRRIFEWDRATNASEPTGSILDIHVLRDGRRAVLERSNGELRLVDLRRTLCPVVEFVPGVPKRYLPHLRCAIDTNESVVVAGGDVQHPRTIQSFDLRHGRLVASIDVQSAHGVETPSSTLVQQVQFMSGPDGSYYDDMPGIWAIARNELFVCTGRRPDRVKE